MKNSCDYTEKREMNKRKSDLIIEHGLEEESLPVHSPTHRETNRYGFKITSSDYCGAAYSTVTAGNICTESGQTKRRLVKCIAELLSEHFGNKNARTFLVVGLGNSAITSDSLGPLAASRVQATDSLLWEMGFSKICVITPGVPARTGLDTAETVLQIAKQISAETIIAIDSLCAISPDRLGSVIQISEGGISPGSAFFHTSGEISERTMPCPVVSIGVPTVIRAATLSPAVLDQTLLVSPADLDITIDSYASIIAGGINRALLGNKRECGITHSSDA